AAVLGESVFGNPKGENRTHAVLAQVRRHFLLGVVLRLRVPGALLLGELLLRLQHVAALRAPVGVHVDDLHRPSAVMPFSLITWRQRTTSESMNFCATSGV